MELRRVLNSLIALLFLASSCFGQDIFTAVPRGVPLVAPPSLPHLARSHGELSSGRWAYPNMRVGLAAAWAPFLGPSGSTVHDITSWRNHGTFTNLSPSSDWVPGGVNRLAGWSVETTTGTTQNITVPRLARYETGEGTLILHFILTNHTSDEYLYQHAVDHNCANGVVIRINDPEGTWSFRYGDGAASFADGGTVPTPPAYVNLAFVAGGPTASLGYHDGVQVVSGGTGDITWTSATNILIGTDEVGETASAKFLLAMWYTRRLSPTEIMFEYQHPGAAFWVK